MAASLSCTLCASAACQETDSRSPTAAARLPSVSLVSCEVRHGPRHVGEATTTLVLALGAHFKLRSQLCMQSWPPCVWKCIDLCMHRFPCVTAPGTLLHSPLSAVHCAGHWLQIQARLSLAQHEGADQLSVLPPRGHLAHGIFGHSSVWLQQLPAELRISAC